MRVTSIATCRMEKDDVCTLVFPHVLQCPQIVHLAQKRTDLNAPGEQIELDAAQQLMIPVSDMVRIPLKRVCGCCAIPRVG